MAARTAECVCPYTVLADIAWSARLAAMEVHFTAEQEARLSEIANQAGTNAEHLVKSAALRLLERDAGFRAAVQKGIEQADRGEFVPDDEMEARIERMLQP
jgi:predicted transcriptional regulator